MLINTVIIECSNIVRIECHQSLGECIPLMNLGSSITHVLINSTRERLKYTIGFIAKKLLALSLK